MEKVIKGKIEAYYETENERLYLGDSFKLLQKVRSESIDLIFADPPYFLSNNGTTCKAGTRVSVNKGKWDEGKDLKEKHVFNRKWIKLCKKCLKPDGSIWISGTFHNIYSIGMALEQEGFKIINNITWQKTNPPPNLGCRCFTHSTETVLWAKKNKKSAKHIFNYQLMKDMNNNKQMKDVWTGSVTKPSEKKEGKHPTQKPEYLLEKVILATSNELDIILDPFCGSGTTGVVAKKYNRIFIGFDNEVDYLEISKKRLEKIDE